MNSEALLEWEQFLALKDKYPNVSTDVLCQMMNDPEIRAFVEFHESHHNPLRNMLSKEIEI